MTFQSAYESSTRQETETETERQPAENQFADGLPRGYWQVQCSAVADNDGSV